jgi:hypothetical protein
MAGLLLAEAIAFALAALTHYGIIPLGLDDSAAAIAETSITTVLLVGAWLVHTRPTWARRAAIAAQGYALAGATLGLVIFLRVDPDKVADIVYHAVMVVVLIAGIVLAIRLPRRTPADG